MSEDEFDDVERSGTNGIYVQSKKARDAMTALARKHGLTFTHNPGGGEFYRRDTDWRCQVSTCDDVDDLAKLRAALAEEKP